MYLHSLVYAFAGGIFDKYLYLMCLEQWQTSAKELLAIRRIFSLVDMITNTKFSNCPNVFKKLCSLAVKYA